MKKLCSLFMTAFTAIALTVPAFAASQTDPTGSWGMWFKYMLAAAVFFAGLLMNAAQSSMQALAAAYYPTAGRATGVAWTLGIGRFGGIAGSFLVAELARRHLPLPEVFILVGVPGLIAAAALLIKDRCAPDLGKPVFVEASGTH